MNALVELKQHISYTTVYIYVNIIIETETCISSHLFIFSSFLYF